MDRTEAQDGQLTFVELAHGDPPRHVVFLGDRRLGEVWSPDGYRWHVRVDDAYKDLNAVLDSRHAAAEVLASIFKGTLLSGTRPSHRRILALSWQVASEMLRRYPTLLLIETHPGGGQYDCLTLLRRFDSDWQKLIDFNRPGSAHVFTTPDNRRSFRDFWHDVAANDDVVSVVANLAREANLAPKAGSEAATHQGLAVRTLAAVLAAAAVDRKPWDVRNGYLDSSGGDGGFREELFEEFPAAQRAAERHDPHDLLGNPAYRFWFVLRADEPLACVETTGAAWTRHHSVDLNSLYASNGRRITPLTQAIAGEALP